MTSSLERAFETWRLRLLNDLPEPKTQYVFDPTRRWRFDVAWPDRKVAVELEGGIWSGGAHVRGKRFISDCDKYNAAALQGWKVLRYTSNHLRDDPMSMFAQIRAALGGELPLYR